MKEYKELIRILGTGKRNARKTAELAEMLDVDMRTIRTLSESARNDGNLVCGCCEGLFLAETREEAEEWLRVATAKAKSLLRSLKNARRFVRQCKDRESGQITLDDI